MGPAFFVPKFILLNQRVSLSNVLLLRFHYREI